MKQYVKLPIPKDSIHDRKWFNLYKKSINYRIRYFFSGICNIIRWIPTIYQDADWDHYYILNILQKKIENQRKYLVNANRYTKIYKDNYWMTVALNLIERTKHEHYSVEYLDYAEFDNKLVPSKTREGCFEWKQVEISENWDDYLSKYKSTVRKILKKQPELINNKYDLSHRVAWEVQLKCNNLMWEVLKRKLSHWWD